MTKILAIDDKQDNLTTLSAVLKNLIPGCTVITAQSGAKGIERAIKELPDTILLDIKMPRIDGFEVCKRLKSADKTRHIPIIMFTAARTDTKSRIKGLDLGADAFLGKPIDESELAAQVNVMLRIKKAEDILRKEKDLLEEAVQERTKELSESEARFRLLYERAPSPYHALNEDGNLMEVNEAWLNMLGYSREEVIGRWFGDFLDPQYVDYFKRNFTHFKASDGVGGIEIEMVRKDGSCVTVEFNGNIGYDKNGKFKQTHCIFQNITERKRAEDALQRAHNELEVRVEERTVELVKANEQLKWEIGERKRAEEKLKRSLEFSAKILKNSPNPIININPDTSISYVNPSLERLTGFSSEELVGTEAPYPFWPKDFVKEIQKDLKSAMLKGATSIQEPFQKKSGERFWVAITSLPITHKGKLDCYLANWVDITERKQAKEMLQKAHDELESRVEKRTAELTTTNEQLVREITERKLAEEDQVRLATAIEQATEIVIITNTEGMIQYINPAFERISGYTREDAVSQNFRIFNSDKHDDTFYKMMWNTLTRGEVWSGHIINRKKDGLLYEVEATFSPVRDKTGAIINYVALQRDITIEVQLEKQLHHAQKLEAIGTLAGGIAHDFNNILAGIMGYTEMALHQFSKKATGYEYLHRVLDASYRAKDLVKQILAFSRQVEQERKPVQIALVIKEAIKLLRASLPSTIELCQNIEAASCSVLADPTRIHQVLINLCMNAAHAMREKGGVLEVSLAEVDIDADTVARHPDLKVGPYLRLSVSDTGHGMAGETMDRIFDPYFTTMEKGKGTGLGLAVVHGIIKSLGGTITVDSEPGKGTTFQVFLHRIETRIKPHVETGVLPLPRGHECILLVDDEEYLADMWLRMLEHLGYEVVAKTSGIEALEIFRSQPDKFDIVITDQTMPKMTGVDLAKELMHIRSNIPIILCSGFSEAITPEKAKAMGIREFVMKPMVMREMAETIRRVVEKE